MCKSIVVAALFTLCACGAPEQETVSTKPRDERATRFVAEQPPVTPAPEPVAVVADSNCPAGKTEVSPLVCVGTAPVVELHSYVMTDRYTVSGNVVRAPAGRAYIAVRATITNRAAERIYLNISLREFDHTQPKVMGIMHGSEVVSQWLWSYAEPFTRTTGWVMFEVAPGRGLDTFESLAVITHMGAEFLPVFADTQAVGQVYVPVE